VNITILSRNAALYSTQSLIKAARDRKHFVRVIDYANCDFVIRNGKPDVEYFGESLYDTDAVIPRIGASFTKLGVGLLRQLEVMDIFSVLSSRALSNSRDKLSCLQILVKNDLLVPHTLILHNGHMYEELVDTIGEYPVIIKLISGTHGIGVLKAESRSQAVSLLETFNKTKQKVLVQEFIEEAKGADYRLFVVDGEVVAAMKRQAKAGEFRSNLHRGGFAEAIKPTEEEKQVALKAVKLLGLHVAGVDMLRSNRGPMILEVNASPGLEGIENTTRVDIAGKIIQFIERSTPHV
jgi:ribosomal protein S6--L-glutamate ligase